MPEFVCDCFEESGGDGRSEHGVSGLVRTEGGVGIRSALMWHQYLCPRLCFLSLGCHTLPIADNVSLDYVIELGARGAPHPHISGPDLPLLFPHNALDGCLKGPAKTVAALLWENRR